MNPRWHRLLTQTFLAANSLFWLPWGFLNLVRPESWSGEVRPAHRHSAFLFFLLALTGLSLCRLGGMIVEGEPTWLSFGTTIAPGQYNQAGLAMYELPSMILAWVLFLARPRHALQA